MNFRFIGGNKPKHYAATLDVHDMHFDVVFRYDHDLASPASQ